MHVAADAEVVVVVVGVGVGIGAAARETTMGPHPGLSRAQGEAARGGRMGFAKVAEKFFISFYA